MEHENYETWKVSDLKEYLLQYDITTKNIKGSGKNGNVVKKDLIRTVKKINKKETQEVITQQIQPNNITMNNDVINYIYSNVNDIDTIINICTTNKAARIMCSNKVFWNPILIANDLHLPQIEYKTAQEWIQYIQKEVKIKEKINNILNIMDKYIKRFKSNIKNENNILNIFNKHKNILHDYHGNVRPPTDVTLIFYSSDKDKNKYYAEVIYYDNYVTYKININQLKEILYDLISKKYILL